MTPELWQRLKPLYEAALELEGEERAQFLAEACQADSELGDELQRLVDVEGLSSPLDRPVFDFDSLLEEPPPTFAAGELVNQRFKIVRLLGSGGMGEVYEAIDLQLGRVALKTIRTGVEFQREHSLRFKREVQLARKVTSPYVCRIHELHLPSIGPEGSKEVFLTMEFLEGVTLADKLHEAGSLSWQETRSIALDICSGLQSIHEAGIIHRDLKGRNIMLTRRNGSECAVLMDFGIARPASRHSGDTSTALTGLGVAIGTPDYMAPEQSAGKDVSAATDIYALGIVLCELLTGSCPVEAPSGLGKGISRVKRVTVSQRRGVPRRMDRIVQKCLEYDPARRYQTAKELEKQIRTGSVLPGVSKPVFTALAALSACLLLSLTLLIIPAVREWLTGLIFSSREKHIAVLPFDVIGNAPETQALADGLMDSLAGRLSNLDSSNHGLWVVPASEVRSRKVTTASQASQEFGATIVVKGSFERENSAARLRLTLIDPKKMREVGFLDIPNQDGDLAGLQEEAVRRLGLLMHVSEKGSTSHNAIQPATHAAYEDYLAGIGFLQRYDKAGYVDGAIERLKKASDESERFPLATAKLGEAYRLKYQLDKDSKWLELARSECERALREQGDLDSALITLGKIEDDFGDHTLAINAFQTVLRRNERDAEAWNGVAHAYEHAGQLKEAERAFQQSTALRPDYWDGHNELAEFFDRQHRFEESIAEYKVAIDLTPDNAQVYADLGGTYLDSKNPAYLPLAEQALSKSVKISPNYTALTNFGLLYWMQKRFPESAKSTQEALLLNDHDWRVWDNLVNLYEVLGDTEKARKARTHLRPLLEKEVLQKPKDADAQSSLATLYASEQQRDKALRRIQAALALAPADADVTCNVAKSYEMMGDRSVAVKYLERAFAEGTTRSDVEFDVYLRRVMMDASFEAPSPKKRSTAG